MENNKNTNNRKVKGSLIGIDGNAFALMGHFRKLARSQEFSNEWIQEVLDDAMSKDYNYLLNTLMSHMEDD